jgi:hypothetical protein
LSGDTWKLAKQKKMDNRPRESSSETEWQEVPWKAERSPSPPDHAAGKSTKGKLKRPLDMRTSSEEDIDQRPGKHVKFNAETDTRAITPFVYENVEMEYKSNIDIMEEHKPIFKETCREVIKLYRWLRDILGSSELISRAGLNIEDIRALQSTYNSLHDFKKKETTSDEDCKKFLGATEKAIDMLNNLGNIAKEVEKSEQERAQQSH